MAIPRHIIVIAASAAVTGLALYARKRLMESQPDPSRSRHRNGRPQPPTPSASHAGPAAPNGSPVPASDKPSATILGAARELSHFLAGDTWHDEGGWKEAWSRDAVLAPQDWLRTTGREVLAAERAKLAATPALLAGCRRRWIVVCRYAGLSVDDAAAIWTSTDDPAGRPMS